MADTQPRSGLKAPIGLNHLDLPTEGDAAFEDRAERLPVFRAPEPAAE